MISSMTGDMLDQITLHKPAGACNISLHAA